MVREAFSETRFAPMAAAARFNSSIRLPISTVRFFIIMISDMV